MDFDDLDGAEEEAVEGQAEEKAELLKQHLASIQPYLQTVDPAELKPLRLGILSTADINDQGVVGPTAKCPQAAVIVAIASREREKANGWYAMRQGILPQCKVHDSYQEVLDDPNVEAVYVPLTNGLHYEWTMNALKAGKHVLVEKPFASNCVEAQKMVALAREKGLLAMEGQHWSYHPVAKRIKEMIDDGKLGTLKEIYFSFRLNARVKEKWLEEKGTFDLKFATGKMWFLLPWQASGCNMQLGTYCMNVLRILIGEEPEIESCKARCLADEADMDCYLTGEVKFPVSGVIGKWEASWIAKAEFENDLVITGTDGTLKTSKLMHPVEVANVITVDSDRGSFLPETCDSSPYNTYDLQLLAFVDRVRQVQAGQAKPDSFTNTGDAVINQMKVLDKNYVAAGMNPRVGPAGIKSTFKKK